MFYRDYTQYSVGDICNDIQGYRIRVYRAKWFGLWYTKIYDATYYTLDGLRDYEINTKDVYYDADFDKRLLQPMPALVPETSFIGMEVETLGINAV